MSTVEQERVARLRRLLAESDLDAWLPATLAGVRYATGHQYAALTLGEVPGAAAVVTAEDAVLCAPAGEWAAATYDAGDLAQQVRPYGSFHYRSRDGGGPGAPEPDLATALVRTLTDLGLTRSRVGHDLGLSPQVLAEVGRALPDVELVDGAVWGLGLRRTKTPGEIALLAASARLASDGIAAAIALARTGMTERELMAEVGRVMLAGGGLPSFLVVTAGERSAHADAWATDRPLRAGDLVRFDVGCTLDGYWSDVGRTAVVGEPSAEQVERYAAIRAGEDEQLAMLRGGVAARDVFRTAVEVVERGGVTPYHRHHCGHAIGLEIYEPPFVTATSEDLLEPGMVLCLETPFYELGWGGMMVEDTVLVTEDGYERYTDADRDLVVIEP